MSLIQSFAREMQDELESELSHEKEAHMECRAQLMEREESVRGLEVERDELKHWLSETSAAVEEEQKRSSSLEVHASYTAFEHS